MKRILCLVLAVLLCIVAWTLSASAEETEETGKNGPDDLFSGTGALRLVRADCEAMPGQMPETDINIVKFLDVSPDGKTGIYVMCTETPVDESDLHNAETETVEASVSVSLPGRTKRGSSPKMKQDYQLCLFRGGQLIPVRPNAGRGDGDPSGKLDTFLNYVWELLPAREGISWSADGRYAVLSCLEWAHSGCNINLPVVDTAAGEIWFADGVSGETAAGMMLLNRFGRSGDYIYYLAATSAEKQWVYRFCRVAAEGGEREILYEMPAGKEDEFKISTFSNITEAADGRWLLLGEKEEGSTKYDTVVRLIPSAGGWSAETTVTPLPCALMMPVTFHYSPVSGYGLMTLANVYDRQRSEMAAAEEGHSIAAVTMNIANRVNLLRLIPEADFRYDVWYLRMAGSDPETLEAVPAEAYLQYIVMRMMQQIPEYPEGFSPEDAVRNPIPTVCSECVSPDGRYALLCVRYFDYSMYMMDLATMEIRYVESPEGAAGAQLLEGPPYGGRNRPGMIWRPDGTIMIAMNDGTTELFRLETDD